MSEEPSSPAPAAGRLAQVIATRGGQAPPEAPFVIEHREALIYILCQAAELEHGIMAQYLFAAFSLKQSAAEGLTEAELAAAARWRRQIMHIAAQEMLHLALVQNLLSAIGAAPHLTRPNFPQPASHYPAGVHLALLPFGEQALRHFMFLERPEGMALHDAEGLAAFNRAAPLVQAGDIVPRGQDFATVGHLYRSIEAGIAHLAEKYGEDWLFVGPPRAQATARYFRWPELVAVTDAASAQRAIDEILEQGEGPRGAWQDAHFGQFVAILDEFEQLREANRAFDPARPVIAANVRPSERDPGVPAGHRPGGQARHGPVQRLLRDPAACLPAVLRAHRGDRRPARRPGRRHRGADGPGGRAARRPDHHAARRAGIPGPGPPGPASSCSTRATTCCPTATPPGSCSPSASTRPPRSAGRPSPELPELAPVRAALHDIARSLAAHMPGRPVLGQRPAGPAAAAARPPSWGRCWLRRLSCPERPRVPRQATTSPPGWPTCSRGRT